MRAFCVARAPCSGHASDECDADGAKEGRKEEGKYSYVAVGGEGRGKEGRRRRRLGCTSIRRRSCRPSVRPILPSFWCTTCMPPARRPPAVPPSLPFPSLPHATARRGRRRWEERSRGCSLSPLSPSLSIVGHARSPAGLSARSQPSPLSHAPPHVPPPLPPVTLPSPSLPPFLLPRRLSPLCSPEPDRA